jgi:hypothetical protein
MRTLPLLALLLSSLPAHAEKTAAGGGIAACSYKDELPLPWKGTARFYREQGGFKLFLSEGSDKQPRTTYVCVHGDKSVAVFGMVGAEEGSVKLSKSFLYVRSVTGAETSARNVSFQADKLADIHVKDWKLYAKKDSKDLLLQSVELQTEYYFPTEGLDKAIDAGGKSVGNSGKVARYVLRTPAPRSKTEGGLAVHLMDGDDAKAVMRKAVKKFGDGTPCMDGDKIASKLAAFIKGMGASKKLPKMLAKNGPDWSADAPTFSLRCDAPEGATVASVMWESQTVLKLKAGKLVAAAVEDPCAKGGCISLDPR